MAARTDSDKALKVTLVKSGIACQEKHRRILKALGLRKRDRSVTHVDRPEIRGMLDKVSFLVEVESVPFEEHEARTQRYVKSKES